MTYLVDTCVLSELWKPRPDRAVVAWLASAKEPELHISVLTLGELAKGVQKLRPSKKREELAHWISNELRSRFGDRVLPITHEVALVWGKAAGDAERAGKPLPVIDALLGATALVSCLAVVTRNVRDIQRTGARVVNPGED